MLATERLVMRQWQASDRAPFAVMNADSDVMRYFENVRTRQESDETANRLERHIETHGFGFWAVELRQSREFIGFIGLEHVSDAMPFAPAVEIGWRIDKRFWGKGLAPEGARACLAYAFARLALDEVVSFTARENQPSYRVMEKIGMRRDKSRDFDHPLVDAASPLRPHVFYRIKSTDPIMA